MFPAQILLFQAIMPPFSPIMAGRGTLWCVLAALSLLLLEPQARAADNSWTGAVDIDWGTNGNWIGGKPTSNDVAVFDRSLVYQPNLGSNSSLGGIWMKTGVAQNMIITGIGNLVLNANTIGGMPGLGVLVDNSSAFTLVINAPLKVNNVQTWMNASANLLAIGGAIDLNNRALTLDGSGNSTLSGIVSSGGDLIKAGNGTLTLSAVNTYTGGTTINAGTVSINSASSLGASSGALTINAGTLAVSNTFTATRTITLGNAASTFQIDPSQTFTVTTAIGGSGSLNKTGAGTLVLGASETYAGSTNVSAGVLELNASNRIPDASALNLSGGTLDLKTFSDTVGTVTLAGGAIIGSGAGTLTSSSSYTLQNGSASAILAGAGAVTKNTAGTVTLTGVNTFTGDVTINAGTLTLAAGAGGALGATNAITVNSGGTLLLGANDQIKNTASVTLNGGIFAKGNFNEGGASTPGVGALTLTSTGSRLDFGTGTAGVLEFASLTTNGFVLAIDNWTGSFNTVGGSMTDRLIFSGNQSGNLAAFSFTGFNGAAQFDLGGGYYEIVPVSPVPEPGTYAAGLLALLALAWQQRARLMNFRTSLVSCCRR